MQGKSLFIERVRSRTREWQCRFPALCASSSAPTTLSQGRQVVVATTSPTGVRCVFLSNHGSVLDFSASWDELSRAKTWWHFVRRWNFWIAGSEADLRALRAGDDGLFAGIALGHSAITGAGSEPFLALLDAAESRARGWVAGQHDIEEAT